MGDAFLAAACYVLPMAQPVQLDGKQPCSFCVFCVLDCVCPTDHTLTYIYFYITGSASIH